MTKTFRVHIVQTAYQRGYVDIDEGEDWDGRPVNDEFDARDLAYDLVADGTDRAHYEELEYDDFEIGKVEKLNA